MDSSWPADHRGRSHSKSPEPIAFVEASASRTRWQWCARGILEFKGAHRAAKPVSECGCLATSSADTLHDPGNEYRRQEKEKVYEDESVKVDPDHGRLSVKASEPQATVTWPQMNCLPVAGKAIEINCLSAWASIAVSPELPCLRT